MIRPRSTRGRLGGLESFSRIALAEPTPAAKRSDSERKISISAREFWRLQQAALDMRTPIRSLVEAALEDFDSVDVAALHRGSFVRHDPPPAAAIEVELAGLLAVYQVAREQAARAAMHPAGAAPADTCRYCGRPRVVCGGTGLDGHARCVVTAEFCETLLVSLERTTLRLSDVASAFGVSPKTIHAWCRIALEMRSERRTGMPRATPADLDARAAIGRALKDWLVRIGMTQRRLAAWLGIGEPPVSNWCTGATPIPARRLDQLREMGFEVPA